jgi:hypothetical protein
MPEESLLTPELRAFVGKSTTPVPVQVTSQAVRRAMDVFYGHHRRDFAPGDPVPGVVIAALVPESESLEFPSPLPNGILISDEWQFERPLRLGEELAAENTIADISERFGGQFGYSIYTRFEMLLRDATGAVVARSGRTMMNYDAASARGGGQG